MKRWKMNCGHKCKLSSACVKWNKNSAWRDMAERYDCQYCAIYSWCVEHSKCLVSLNSTSSHSSTISIGIDSNDTMDFIEDLPFIRAMMIAMLKRGDWTSWMRIFSRIFRFRLQKRRNIVSDLSLHIRRMRLLNVCGEKAPFLPTRGDMQRHCINVRRQVIKIN